MIRLQQLRGPLRILRLIDCDSNFGVEEAIIVQQYRVGVIGTQFAELVHIPAFLKHRRFAVVSIAGRSAERTARVATEFNISNWYTDWRGMLSAGGFDIVSIVTPPHLHCDMALASLEGGYHVLCEKPMALHGKQAREMLLAAQGTGLTAMVNLELRYLPAFRKFGELLGSGYIGEPMRLILSYHLNTRSDSKLPWDWWSDRAQGGGLLGALGPHLFDAVCQWLGGPRRVWGKLSTAIPIRPMPNSSEMSPVTADDSLLAVLDLGNGVEAVLDLTSTSQHSLGYAITAIGNKGTVILENAVRLVGAQGNSKLQELGEFRFQGKDREDWRLSPFLRLLDDFADGIDRGFSPSPNFVNGVAHQQIIDAVKLSSDSGCWVEFDRAQEVTGC